MSLHFRRLTTADRLSLTGDSQRPVVVEIAQELERSAVDIRQRLERLETANRVERP
jgi:hypothetical protein